MTRDEASELRPCWTSRNRRQVLDPLARYLYLVIIFSHLGTSIFSPPWSSINVGKHAIANSFLSH